MSPIIASNIHNINIYGEQANPLDLCNDHQQSLCEILSEKINDLVATPLFQTCFKDFLPTDDQDTSEINIQMTAHSITVGKDGHFLTVTLDKTDVFDQEEIERVQDINEQLIQQANQTYHHCHKANPPSEPTTLFTEKATQTDSEVFPLSPSSTNGTPTFSVITHQQFETLINISQNLSTEPIAFSYCFPLKIKQEFETLPEELRHSIYYQTYLLIDLALIPSELHWPIGERLFQETNPEKLKMTNLARAHAIHHFLFFSLSREFASIPTTITPSSELLYRFNQLPEQDKQEVYMQLHLLQQNKRDNDALQTAENAFFEKNGQTATNRERSEALHRALLNRLAEYHHYLHQLNLEQMAKAYSLFTLEKEMALVSS